MVECHRKHEPVSLSVCARNRENLQNLIQTEVLNCQKESINETKSVKCNLPIIAIPRFQTEQAQLNAANLHDVIHPLAVGALSAPGLHDFLRMITGFFFSGRFLGLPVAPIHSFCPAAPRAFLAEAVCSQRNCALLFAGIFRFKPIGTVTCGIPIWHRDIR